MKKLLIKNISHIATMNDKMEIFKDCDILIEENRIAKIENNIRTEANEIIDGSDHIALPGFINTHHHMYQVLTRCIPNLLDAPLFKWLTNLYEIWRHLSEEGIYLSTKAAISELLLTGCTSSSDHLYVFPEGCNSFIDVEIETAKEMGIRFFPTRGCMSRGRRDGGLPPDDVVQREDEILFEFERVFKKYHDSSKYSMINIGLSPCSPFSVTEGLLGESAKFAREHNLRLHTHLAETIDEENYCKEKHGKRPLDYMNSLGWLGKDVWYAHGIHFNDEELKMISDSGTSVAHCPTSNMRLMSGTARIREMVDLGVTVGLAVDGSASNDSSNLMREVKMALYLSRTRKNVSPLSHLDVLWMATRGGAKLLGRDDLGSIEIDKAADIILYDVSGVEFAGNVHDPVASLIYCGISDCVDISIVNGKIVVRDGKVLNLDEQNLKETVNREARRQLIEKQEG